MLNQCAKTAIKPELWKKNDSNTVQEILHWFYAWKSKGKNNTKGVKRIKIAILKLPHNISSSDGYIVRTFGEEDCKNSDRYDLLIQLQKNNHKQLIY